jgi:hypothetical protein
MDRTLVGFNLDTTYLAFNLAQPRAPLIYIQKAVRRLDYSFKFWLGWRSRSQAELLGKCQQMRIAGIRVSGTRNELSRPSFGLCCLYQSEDNFCKVIAKRNGTEIPIESEPDHLRQSGWGGEGIK